MPTTTSQPQQSQTRTADRNLLSDKELHYLKDFLSWELLAMKKYYEAANNCTDPRIQGLLKQTGQKHRQHFETLLSHMK